MFRIMMIAVVSLIMASDVQAQWRRGRWQQGSSCQNGNCQIVQGGASQQATVYTEPIPAPPIGSTPKAKVTGSRSDDALDEVNAARAARGLRPYVNDPVLNEGARKCAEWRAVRLCSGHCSLPHGDFTLLPSVYPVGSCAGGCAAWPPSLGWGACATYDNYTYCGAAWVMGSDGQRYMHLFVR